jgi:F-type H+-transporting ATPase subunit 8
MHSLKKIKLKKKIFLLITNMPQIIPFYFVSQIFVTFMLLFLVIFVLSKYILPVNLFNQVIRSYIVKLTNKS